MVFKKSKLNSHWQDMCEKKCHLLFLSTTNNLIVVLTWWKRNTFKISMKYHLKKKLINFETLFSPSFDVLYISPIVYMNHTELIFQGLLLYWTKKVPEYHNNFFLSLFSLLSLPGACSDLYLGVCFLNIFYELGLLKALWQILLVWF